MNYIELFAGCGGFSLGLESAGYELLFANELSPMASETFSYNYFNEDLDSLARKGVTAKHTLWLNSKYKRNELSKRLRENPKETPKLGRGYNDLLEKNALIKNSIIVGRITDLNNFLANNKKMLNLIKRGFGTGKVDLVSGGPPCQSFSMAGLRQHDDARNKLPWEFAKFVDLIRPKVVMLENVTGILRAFNVGGENIYAWSEVAKVFASIGYVPLCLHVNAKYSGAAQNRPRFIMIAIRANVFYKFKRSVNNGIERSMLNNSYEFYKLTKNNSKNISSHGRLKVHDLEKLPAKYDGTFLSPLLRYREDSWHSVGAAIDDLRNGSDKPASNYVNTINKQFKSPSKSECPKEPLNHILRANGTRVRKRFRLYQVLALVSHETNKEIARFLRSSDNHISENAIKEMQMYELLINENEHIKFNDRKNLEEFLVSLKTRKQTQKALLKEKPAPAALSIPDDACHYHSKELRTLTVREMARIQSFPDWFEFRSKVTTGGKMRRFEVPQYTQVGNAVPPFLGLALGKVVTTILKSID